MMQPAPAGAGARAGARRRASRPGSDEDLAFASVAELSALIRSRRISSTELTRLYLQRIDRYDPILRAVITRTEPLALEQAARADREIALGASAVPCTGSHGE